MALEWESVEIRCRHCDGTGVAFFPPGWCCQFCGGTGKMRVARLKKVHDGGDDSAGAGADIGGDDVRLIWQ